MIEKMTQEQNMFHPREFERNDDMYTRKRHLIDLPYCNSDVSFKFDYPTGAELAMVIPIFGVADDIRHHLYAKGAIYNALSFLKNTDIKEQSVKLYFAIGDSFASEIKPYLNEACVPDKNVIIFHDYNADCLRPKHAAMFHPNLQYYKKLLFIDADVWVHRPPGGDYLRVFELLKHAWNRPFLWGAWEAKNENWHPFHIEWRRYQDKLDEYWQRLSHLVQRPLDEVKRVFHIGDRTIPRANGWCVGFQREVFQSQDFRIFYENAQSVLCQDESIMSAWIYKNGSNPELWDTPPFWTENYYDLTHTRTRIYHLASDEHLHDDNTAVHYETWKDQWLAEMEELTQ